LLAELEPNAVGEARERITRIDAELENRLDEARTVEAQALPVFVQVTHRLISQRSRLENRVRAIAPAAELPDRESGMQEIHEWVRRVRRWKDGSALRIERVRLLGALKAELAPVEAELATLVNGYRSGVVYSGRDPRSDVFLARAETLIARRSTLVARMAALDGGDPGRSAAIATALGASGGADAVGTALAVAIPGNDDLVKQATDQAAALGRRLDTIDPETRAAAAVRSELDAARARIEQARENATEARSAAAKAMVQGALGGSLSAIAALAEAAGRAGLPALVAALDPIRGAKAELVAVVAEMIDRQAEAEAAVAKAKQAGPK